MLCLVSPESRVPRDHPLRAIRCLADEALGALSTDFDAMYAEGGRPSVPPERLLKGSLLIALYSLRSERQLCEQLEYNLLFRWFLDCRTRFRGRRKTQFAAYLAAAAYNLLRVARLRTCVS